MEYYRSVCMVCQVDQPTCFLYDRATICLIFVMKRSEIALMIAQVPVDFFFLLLAAGSAYYLRFSDMAIAFRPVLFSFSLHEFLTVIYPVALGWIIIFAVFGLYSTDQNRKLGSDLVRVFFACSVGLAGVAVYVMFSQQLFDSRFLALASWGVAVVYISIGRMLIRGVKGLLYRWGIGKRRVVLIGEKGQCADIVETFSTRPELGYTVVEVFEYVTDRVFAVLDGLDYDEVIVLSPKAREKETLKLLAYCNKRHKTFKYSADLFATYAANMAVYPVAGMPMIELKRTKLEGWWRVIKRVFDIVVSCICIVVFSPFMIVSALIILIETGRPVIYKNLRVGIRGQEFFTLKFRSMYKEESTGPQFGDAGKKAEEREKLLLKKQNSKKGPIYKIANDPRVTPFGRFIRRWSIDELPQLFNVLGGSMSLVGPRPHQPREVDKYKDTFPVVFTLKPGMTGLAQISGRSDLAFEEEMKLDILYTERWSILLDGIILLKTPFILLKRRKVL
jgi:exopolysaccharide biosynthesis polyprenyl glycosylphosphotransferase